MTDRGFYESCGNAASVAADPDGCDGQYVRMMDDRYEVRDAQYFAGQLVDEGWVQPTKVAATGGSYGGGISMALAALKDRTMKPDGRLVPWTSPNGTPMSLAVAAPLATWSDFAYSMGPNGRTLDYLRDNSYDPDRFGVMKPSIMNGLYFQGLVSGRISPPGVLPAADMTGWLGIMDQGEPYQNNIAASGMLSEVTTYHSSYYIDHSEKPAPLLIAQGFTDDIFPVDESLRFYNRTMAQYPNADIGMIFGDFGHQRGQNKPADGAPVFVLQDQWIDDYRTGAGSPPANTVIARTEVCPSSSPSAGPFTASDWASLAPGEITVEGGSADQTIEPDGGSGDVADAFNVLVSNACASPSGDKEPERPTSTPPPLPPVASRCWAPRRWWPISKAAATTPLSPPASSTWRPAAPSSSSPARSTGLTRAATRCSSSIRARGSSKRATSRLELLPKDGSGPAAPGNLTNYSRPSNLQQPITVHDLVFRLPVIENPGDLGGLVKSPAPKILPDDRGPVDLAPGYSAPRRWPTGLRPAPDAAAGRRRDADRQGTRQGQGQEAARAGQLRGRRRVMRGVADHRSGVPQGEEVRQRAGARDEGRRDGGPRGDRQGLAAPEREGAEGAQPQGLQEAACGGDPVRHSR